MFDKQEMPVQPDAALTPVTLPFSILLCLPDYVTSDPGAFRFNLMAAIGRLVGRAGAARSMAVFRPRIWAPGWSNVEFQRFIASPFHDNPELFSKIYPVVFRALDFLPPGSNSRPYDIVQFTGFVEERDGFAALILSSCALSHILAGALLDRLRSARSRLLILQVPRTQFELAEKLANVIVGGGGPAVVVVSGRDAGTVDRFLLNIYANILHNTTIPEVAQPEFWMEYQQLTVQDQLTEQRDHGLQVRVVYGSGGRDLLRLDNYVESLRGRLDTAWQQIVTNTGRLSSVYQEREPFLHRAQVEALSDPGLGHNAVLPIVNLQRAKLSNIAWHHESAGVVPSSEVDDMVTVLESHASKMRKLEDEALNPPRVLNGSFSEPGGPKALSRFEPLRAGRQYDLCVDVGPRRNDSIVSGNGAFPERALPPGQQAWRIQVVLVSNDLEPQVSSAFLWVDSAGGESFPDIDGKKAGESGPVRLRVTAPKTRPGGSGAARLRGRLGLYYQNNLLQSAAMNVAWADEANEANKGSSEANEINVDFSLTSSFQELEKRFGSDEPGVLKAETGKQRVKLSLALNDDGSGRHRILIKEHPEIAPVFAMYDPGDATRSLEDARKLLLECFDGLSTGNGKSRDGFKRDLLQLAQCGRELFQKAFSGVKLPAAGMLSAEWEAQLRNVLAAGKDVIQVARTGPAQYVFPWTLIYEYPLAGLRKDWRFCKVINEQWTEDGVRTTGFEEKSCRYKDEAFHQNNVLCPYGFWGLKHIIEQPLSVLSYENGQMQLGETPEAVRFQDRIEFAVAVSDDLDPADRDHKRRDRHLGALAQIFPIELARSAPANDFYTVRDMLRSPVIVYFLCHGEYDQQKKTTYLSVGLRDGADEHKIYPAQVREWKSAQLLDLASWKRSRPLIFINGCHSVDLTPGEVLNFVTSFADAGASGIVGTEINVQFPLASAVAESLLTKLLQKESIGAAMYQIRWDLANKGSMLGLAYTLNSMASLKAIPGFA